ncbi:MAG TPA: hypothetical protein VFV33_23885, partial [Gemmatimonadaceae bacterium]|nr:hypothetical protein [Gemmatimonadaceae bacterium]
MSERLRQPETARAFTTENAEGTKGELGGGGEMCASAGSDVERREGMGRRAALKVLATSAVA